MPRRRLSGRQQAPAPRAWEPAQPARSVRGRRRRSKWSGCDESLLASELPREVVFERELDLETVTLESVREVLAPAPLQLAAEHHVRRRRVEEVAERVFSDAESVRSLSVGVVVVLERIADRAGELLVPGLIQEHAVGDDRYRLADNRPERIGVVR